MAARTETKQAQKNAHYEREAKTWVAKYLQTEYKLEKPLVFVDTVGGQLAWCFTDGKDLICFICECRHCNSSTYGGQHCLGRQGLKKAKQYFRVGPGYPVWHTDANRIPPDNLPIAQFIQYLHKNSYCLDTDI